MSDEKNTQANNSSAEQASKEKKRKKINALNLHELDEALEKTKKNQGGLFSKYAQELIKRRDYLSAIKK